MDLCGELNRLAGITDRMEWRGIAGAANLWAGTTGLELVGALNVKAGLRVNGTCLELNGVLRRLGFDGYDQGGLTRFTGTPGPGDAAGGGLNNVLRLPGISGNYVNAPDSAALSITGDIDIRVKVAIDDWDVLLRPIVSKWAGSGQRSYMLRHSSSQARRLSFLWTANGSTAITTNATVDVPFANGEAGWIRVTLDVDNGAVGNDVKFYTSSDGTTWTQLGTTVTTVGTTSIFDGTGTLRISGEDETAGREIAGQIYYAEVRNGINGTIVAAFDATTVAVRGDQLPTTVADSYGNTFTVNGSDWWWGTYTGTQRFTQALQLPGTAGNYASTPDSAALSIVGDIDIRAKVALNNWATDAYFVAKFDVAGRRSYLFRAHSSGKILFASSADGTATTVSATSTVVVPFTNGAVGWVRVTFDVDNGAIGNDVKFYTSTDGVTWVQLGATVTTALTTSIFDSAALVTIGAGADAGTGAPAAGTVHYAEIRNGINGTVVGVFNPGILRYPYDQTPTTLKSPTGETYTITGSGWRWVEQTV